jgi:hypothetical protein
MTHFSPGLSRGKSRNLRSHDADDAVRAKGCALDVRVSPLTNRLHGGMAE